MRQSTPLLPSVDEIMYEMTARENSSQVAPAPSDRKKPLVIEPVARRHKTKVAAYCRVSKDDDDQRSSIHAQCKHFLSLIGQHDEWEFAGIYSDSLSGTKKDGRPGLARLLEDCEAKQIDLVLVKSISRLARNTTDLLQMTRKLTSGGTHIIFDREGIDTRTTDSELLLSILASLAEAEVREISQNSRWGLQKRFRDGSYRMANAPYGYDLADGTYVVNTAEADVVRQVFSWAASGMSNRAIAERLNDQGIPTKRAGEVWKGRKISTHWSAKQIYDMLKNEAYIGNSLLQKTYRDETFTRRVNYDTYPKYLLQEHHPAIIDEQRFFEVRELAEKRERGRTQRAARHAFSGMLTCAHCGSPMRREATKAGAYWVCVKHRYRASSCPQPNVRESQIENGFIEALRKIARDKENMESFKREICEEFGRSNAETLSFLKSRRSQIRRQQAKLNHSVPTNALERARFISWQNELTNEDREIQSELDKLADQRIGEADELLALARSLDASSVLFDGEAFKQFVESVTIRGREVFVFRFRCGYTCELRKEVASCESRK